MQLKLSRLFIAALTLGMLAVPTAASAHDPGRDTCVVDRVCAGTHYSLRALFIGADGGQVQVTVEDDGMAALVRSVPVPGGGARIVSSSGVLQDFQFSIDFAAGTSTVKGTLVPTAAQDPDHAITDPTIDLTWSNGKYGSPLIPTPATATACGRNRGIGIGDNKVADVNGTAWGSHTVKAGEPGPVNGQPMNRFTCVYVVV